MLNDKKPYVPPTIECYEYVVEHGFAQSMFLGDVATEDVEHGEDYVVGGESSSDLWY